MKRTGIIILAAGNSSRLGKPKQLLAWDGKMLIQRIVAEALKANPCALVVVTGAYAAEVREALSGTDILIAHNVNWQAGMGSGIRVGLAALRTRHADLERVLLLVCDQPLVTADTLRQMVVLQKETGKGLVACAYSDTVGTPALFDAVYFNELSRADGAGGVKSLLLMHEQDDLATLSFAGGAVDVDTEQDYLHLLATFK